MQLAQEAYLLAQANAEQAAADELAAITDRYEQMTVIELEEARADADLAMEEARLAMLLAQAEFDQDMAEIADAIRIAANTEAGIHAADYATAMTKLSSLRTERLTLAKEIADNELFMKSVTAGSEMTWEVYLEGLERDVLAEKATITAKEEYVVRATEYLGDIDLMEAAYEVAVAAEAAKQAEIDALLDEKGMADDPLTAENEASGIVGNITSEYAAFISEYNTLKGQLDGWKTTVETLEGELETLNDETVPNLQAIIADYDGIKATLEQAVVDAEDRIGFDGTGSAADHEHNHPAAYGLLGDIDAATTALGPLNTAVTNATAALGTYTAPTLGDSPIDPVVTAYDVLFNAELAIIDHDAAYAALTVSYNNAATALAQAQTAYDGNTYAADLATAQGNLTTAQGNLATAQTTYANAKTAYEADTNGSVFADGPDVHASNFLSGGYDEIDLGETGIHSDLAGDTYMRVDTWKETTIGSGEYVPASFYPTKYNASDLAAHITAIKADNAPENLNITVDADIWVWEATGAGGMPINDGGGNLVDGDDHALDAIQAGNADTDNLAVFVNVELDDTSVSNLYNFNVATNMLGSDDFSTRPFFTAGSGTVADPYTFNAVLTPGMANAGYDSTPDADGEADSPTDMLTAQAEVWNAGLEVFKKQNAFDLGDDALIAAQAVYDAQKLLFDEGLVTRAGLVADAAAIEAAGGAVYVALADLAAANAAVVAQQDVIDALVAELGLIEYITTGTPVMGQVLRTLNTGNLFISWDIHANDGVPAADVMYEYLASAGWETAYDGDGAMGDADALTAYAELWNAQNALAIHIATSMAAYETQLATALESIVTKGNLVSEYTIFIDTYQVRLDALTAEYEALMATPFYAEQHVRLVEINDEIAVLTAEKAVLTAEKNALAVTIDFDGLGTVTAIEAAIETAQTYIDVTGPAELDRLAAAIALGEVSVDKLQAEIDSQMLELADLDDEIAAKIVEAEGYLALLNEALGN